MFFPLESCNGEKFGIILRSAYLHHIFQSFLFSVDNCSWDSSHKYFFFKIFCLFIRERESAGAGRGGEREADAPLSMEPMPA